MSRWSRHSMRRWSLFVTLAWLATACRGPSTVPSSVAGVRLSIDTSYYETSGSTPRDWMNAAHAASGPAGVRSPYLATTRWSTRWSSASMHTSAGGCEFQDPQVTLDVKFIMPRLAVDSTVSPDDRLEWQRFSQSLWRHEEGHALRGMRAASEMRDSLVRIHSRECSSLGSLATVAVSAVSDKYLKLQSQYDDHTMHGARQGAILIPARPFRLAVDTTYRDTLP